MMYKLKYGTNPLVVVCVSPDVFDLQGVVVTDGNAASDSTRFAASPGGIAILDEGLVYAEYWTGNGWDYYERKRARCAEVLVPDRVLPQFIEGVKVCDEAHVGACESVGLRGEVCKSVFFR